MNGGIAAIQARVAAIEARFDPQATASSDTATTDGAAFADVLSQVLSATGADAEGSASSLLGGGDAELAAGGLSTAGVLSLLRRSGSAATATSGSSTYGRWGGTGAGGVGTVGGVGAVGTGALVPAERKAPGQYGKLQPPAELQRYGNGRIPAEALVPLGVGNHRLYAPAANAFNRMRADAAAQGVKIGITDSYRDYDTQVSLARRKGLYSQGGLAATPGTSNHGWGLATDLDLDTRALQWMRDNAWRYGFVEDTPREPWHWGYRPAGGVAAA